MSCDCLQPKNRLSPAVSTQKYNSLNVKQFIKGGTKSARCPERLVVINHNN